LVLPNGFGECGVLLDILTFVKLVSFHNFDIAIMSLEAVDHEVVNQNSKSHKKEALEDTQHVQLPRGVAF